MPGNGLVPVAGIRYGQETTILSHGNFCGYRTWLYLTFRTKFVILDHCVSVWARTLMWCQSLQWVSTCKPWTLALQHTSVLGLHSNYMCNLEVRVMWRRALFTYQDYVITSIMLLLASSHEILMRTCVLYNCPDHAWGGDSTQEHRCGVSLQGPCRSLSALCSCWNMSLSLSSKCCSSAFTSHFSLILSACFLIQSLVSNSCSSYFLG